MESATVDKVRYGRKQMRVLVDDTYVQSTEQKLEKRLSENMHRKPFEDYHNGLEDALRVHCKNGDSITIRWFDVHCRKLYHWVRSVSNDDLPSQDIWLCIVAPFCKKHGVHLHVTEEAEERTHSIRLTDLMTHFRDAVQGLWSPTDIEAYSSSDYDYLRKYYKSSDNKGILWSALLKELHKQIAERFILKKANQSLFDLYPEEKQLFIESRYKQIAYELNQLLGEKKPDKLTRRWILEHYERALNLMRPLKQFDKQFSWFKLIAMLEGDWVDTFDINIYHLPDHVAKLTCLLKKDHHTFWSKKLLREQYPHYYKNLLDYFRKHQVSWDDFLAVNPDFTQRYDVLADQQAILHASPKIPPDAYLNSVGKICSKKIKEAMENLGGTFHGARSPVVGLYQLECSFPKGMRCTISLHDFTIRKEREILLPLGEKEVEYSFSAQKCSVSLKKQGIPFVIPKFTDDKGVVANITVKGLARCLHIVEALDT